MNEPLDDWAERLERESPWLQRLARSLVHEEEHARDLVQDTWVIALRRPPRDRSRPRAWLRRVMLNHVRQASRRGRGLPVLEADLDNGREPSPGDWLERDEVLRILAKELARIEEPFHSTLKQHYLHGRTSVEIARRNGIPDGTVRWRLKRGLESLRERLDLRCRDRSVWVGALLAFLPRSVENPAAPKPGDATLAAGPLRYLAMAAGFAGAALVLVAALEFRTGEGRVASIGSDAGESSSRADLLEDSVARLASRSPLAEPDPITIPVTDPTTLEIRVVGADGSPLSDAQVFVATGNGFESRARTLSDGSARVPYSTADLGAFGSPTVRGLLTLRAVARGQAFEHLVSVDPSRARADEPPVIRAYGPSTRIDGVVIDLQGQPAAGVNVSAVLEPNFRGTREPRGEFRSPEVLSTRSGPEGTFSFDGLTRQSYLLCLADPEHEITMTMVTAGEGGVLVQLYPGSRVRGRVTLPDDRPAVGARVWCEPHLRGTEWNLGAPGYHLEMHGFTHVVTTDAEGFYELPGVPMGRRLLFVQAAEEEALVSTRWMDLVDGTLRRWDVRLEAPDPVRIRLLDPDRQPRAGWSLELTASPLDGPSWRRLLSSDTDGRVSCFDAPGPIMVSVQAPGMPDIPVHTALLDPRAEEYDLVVDTARMATLKGCVVEADGSRPCGSLSLLQGDSSMRIPLGMEPDGNFERRLEPGQYSLVLSHGDGIALGCWLGDVSLQPGATLDLGQRVAPPIANLAIRVPMPRTGPGAQTFQLEAVYPMGAFKVLEGGPQSRTVPTHVGLLALTGPQTETSSQTAWIVAKAGRENVIDLETIPGRVRLDLGRVPGRVTLVVRPDVETEDLVEGIERRVNTWPSRACGRHDLLLPEGGWTIEARVPGGARGQAHVQIDGPTCLRVAIDLGF